MSEPVSQEALATALLEINVARIRAAYPSQDYPGSRYDYAGVEKARAFGLLIADSPGKYFAEMIKPHYACTKLPPEDARG